MQVILGSGSISISSIGISIFPHQQPSIAATPQRFGFPQNGQRVSEVGQDMLTSGLEPAG
jgi:hypothetical protein